MIRGSPAIKRLPKGLWPFGFALLLGFLAALWPGCQHQNPGWNSVEAILQRITPPTFPARTFVVTNFGAIGDGQTDCTAALQAAIDACHAAGGGLVLVPEGSFLTGAIHLKSRVNLHLEKGARMLFSRDPKKYLPVVYTRFEGVECMNYSPFIYAFGQEDVAVTGEGTLDGQADTTVWWPWCGNPKHGWFPGAPKQDLDREQLFRMAEEGVPGEKRIFGEGHYLRPNFIQFYKCKRVLVEGVTIERSPMWVIHPVLCENVTVRGVRVVSHGPNNDGCNPESSRDVLITDCYFDTGDDCIAIKSGRNADGRRVGIPSENIVVRNCTMRDGHGGVVMGSETTGGCRNIFVEDCVMDSPNLERALRIKTNSLRGGTVENVFMRNVQVGEVKEAVVHIFYHYGEGDVGFHTPVVRNIFLTNVSSKKSRYALFVKAYERSPVRNLRLEHCSFDGVQSGNVLEHVQGLFFKDVTINGVKVSPAGS
ncbi:MAG: glycoside hydrolase family 28 protein [candidate division KSB1 bacterium]|nr:glycoside hydrolase family 28 protein [candidate division KSB1 bacterium]